MDRAQQGLCIMTQFLGASAQSCGQWKAYAKIIFFLNMQGPQSFIFSFTQSGTRPRFRSPPLFARLRYSESLEQVTYMYSVNKSLSSVTDSPILNHDSLLHRQLHHLYLVWMTEVSLWKAKVICRQRPTQSTRVSMMPDQMLCVLFIFTHHTQQL